MVGERSLLRSQAYPYYYDVPILLYMATVGEIVIAVIEIVVAVGEIVIVVGEMLSRWVNALYFDR